MSLELSYDFFRHYLFSSRAGAVVRRISWLSLLALFFSVAALIIVMSIMTALNTSIRLRTLAVEPHLILEYAPGTSFASIDASPAANKIRNLDPTATVDPFESQDVILRTADGHFHGAVARGVSEQSYHHLMTSVQKMAKYVKSTGDYGDLEGPLVGEVDLGVDLARSLSVFEGDFIMVVPPEGLLLPPSESPPFERVKVRKILATNLADIDGTTMYYRKGLSLTSLKDGASRRNGLEVWLSSSDKSNDVKDQLKDYSGFKVETWQERNSALFFALRMEKSAIMIFLGMAALVSGFSLVTVLTLLTNQKRNEIGILQTLGFSRQSVQQLFSQLGYGLAIAGGGGGLFVGLAVSIYLEKFPLNILPDIYYDSEIPAQVDWPSVGFVFICGVTLALWGARAAAKRAANEPICISLRQKN